MKFDKIVYASDFSETSRQAGQHAVRLARRKDAEVVFAHAHPLTAAQPNRAEEVFGREEFRVALAKAMEQTHSNLEQEREALAGDGTRTSQVLVDEPVDDGIAKAIEELGGKLLVVGSHGRTGAARLLLGSVAEKLVRTQQVPVLVARGEAPKDGYKRVLVPVDHSVLSSGQLESALELAAPDAEVSVLFCWSLPLVTYGVFAEQGAAMTELSEETRRDAGRENELLIAPHVGASQRITSSVIESRPAAGIQTYLEEKGPFDLVVVGDHRPGPVSRLFLGSTATATVRHAPCSVLVARHP